jgi:UDP-glucose 4-epimerase
MKALVTGGAGFIGSHLAERLVTTGHEVLIVDDLSTGSHLNIRGLADRGEVDFVLGSVLDEALISQLMAQVDTVFHLAAAVGVKTILDDPLSAMRTNLRGTEIVLEAACRFGSRAMIMSSSEVYGHNTADALSEDSLRIMGSPLTTRWSYAEAKAIDETLAYCYWRHHRVPAVIVRPFNVVGPRQTGRYGMVIPRFVEQALRGESLTVHGDGTQTRCFCHVAEAVDAFLALIEHPGAYGEVFNVGRREEVSIVDLAVRVVDFVGSASPIRYVPYSDAYPEGFEDMQRRVPDISKARELIGFEPRLGLDDILRSIVSHRSDLVASHAGESAPGIEPASPAVGVLAATDASA